MVKSGIESKYSQLGCSGLWENLMRRWRVKWLQLFHEEPLCWENASGAVCTCVAAKKTPACSYPLGKMRGWSKEISVDTCHAVLAGGTYLLLFVKMEYTIPSAFVQGISSNLSAHCSFIHVTEPHCSLEDGSGDAAVKKALVCLF